MIVFTGRRRGELGLVHRGGWTATDFVAGKWRRWRSPRVGPRAASIARTRERDLSGACAPGPIDGGVAAHHARLRGAAASTIRTERMVGGIPGDSVHSLAQIRRTAGRLGNVRAPARTQCLHGRPLDLLSHHHRSHPVGSGFSNILSHRSRVRGHRLTHTRRCCSGLAAPRRLRRDRDPKPLPPEPFRRAESGSDRRDSGTGQRWRCTAW